MNSTAIRYSRCSSSSSSSTLRLDGDVERGRRLVGDQQLGRQASAMEIIARCRWPPESWCGNAFAWRAGSGCRCLPSNSTARANAARRVIPSCSRQHLGDLVTDRVQRVERGHRLLEDHRDVCCRAAPRIWRWRVAQEVVAVESGSLFVASLRDEAQQRERRHRLARPRLADQAEPSRRRAMSSERPCDDARAGRSRSTACRSTAAATRRQRRSRLPRVVGVAQRVADEGQQQQRKRRAARIVGSDSHQASRLFLPWRSRSPSDGSSRNARGRGSRARSAPAAASLRRKGRNVITGVQRVRQDVAPHDACAREPHRARAAARSPRPRLRRNSART